MIVNINRLRDFQLFHLHLNQRSWPVVHKCNTRWRACSTLLHITGNSLLFLSKKSFQAALVSLKSFLLQFCSLVLSIFPPIRPYSQVLIVYPVVLGNQQVWPCQWFSCTWCLNQETKLSLVTLIEQQGMCSLHIFCDFFLDQWWSFLPFAHWLTPHPASVQLETYASM